MATSGSISDQTVLEAPYDWCHFVARSGPAGQRWARQYRGQDLSEIRRSVQRSLDLLRQWRIEEGHEALAGVGQRLGCLESPPASMLGVMERWYHAALAYYHYCVEDFNEAEWFLTRAHEAVTEVLRLEPFLLPLASHCSDFRFQRIRIARNRRRWQEMQEHIEVARGMLADREPFCVLSDGSPIYFSTVRQFYASIPALNQEEKAGISALLDSEQGLLRFERFVQGIYVLPGFVIPNL